MEKLYFMVIFWSQSFPGRDTFLSRQAPHRVPTPEHFQARRGLRIFAPQARRQLRTHVRFPFYPRRGSAEVASESEGWGSSRPASPLSVRQARVWRPCVPTITLKMEKGSINARGGKEAVWYRGFNNFLQYYFAVWIEVRDGVCISKTSS